MARRFNAGMCVGEIKSRRDDRKYLPSLRDLNSLPIDPGIEMPGYFQTFRWNRINKPAPAPTHPAPTEKINAKPQRCRGAKDKQCSPYEVRTANFGMRSARQVRRHPLSCDFSATSLISVIARPRACAPSVSA